MQLRKYIAIALCALLPAYALAQAAPAAPTSQMSAPVRIVVLGDSVTSGFQLQPGEAFGPQLEAYARARYYDARVVSLSRVGQTSYDGLHRLDEVLAAKPDVVVLELGYNDVLSGADLNQTAKTLNELMHQLRLRDIGVLLLHVAPPDTVRPSQKRQYDYLYPQLAQQYRMPYYLSLLEGISGHPELAIPDKFHPNARGVKITVQRAFPSLEPLLRYAIQMKHYKQKLN